MDIIFVPSIRELNDEFKFTQKSTINKLVSEYVIERILENNEEKKEFNKVENSIRSLSKCISEGESSAFETLKESLSNHMLDYGNIEINFELDPPDVSKLIKSSFKPSVKIAGNELPLESQGMGFQRSLIFSLICNMAEIERKSSNLLILYLIEEPELFLHPNHQDHFRNRLMKLSRQINNQLIITSHSPYFLNNIDNYSQVKRISILDNVSNFKEITHEEVKRICDDNGILMADAFNHDGHMSRTEYEETVKKTSKADVLRYLLWIDPNRANAFLSKRVLLVEGSTEKAFFSFIFNNPDGDFYDHDKKSELMVVDIVGKYHFYKFANLLNILGIPTWILHDGDIPAGANDKISKGISHKSLNSYIVQLKNNDLILDYKRVDPYLEKFLGIKKDDRTPDISIYQKLEENDNNCRQSPEYQELMSFVENILEYQL